MIELRKQIGCSGWIRTSTVPFNRRTDYCYPTEQGCMPGRRALRTFHPSSGLCRKGSQSSPSRMASIKLVTAAGLAPAVTRSQARHVAATLRGVAPAYWERKPGACFFVETRRGQLPGAAAASEIGALDGTCTHTLPADNGLLFYSATRAGGKCW